MCKNNVKKRKALRAFGISVIACAALGILLRTLSLFFFYDADIGYYSRGAVLPIIFNAIMIISAIACAAICFVPNLSVMTEEGFGESRIADILYAVPALLSIYSIIAQMLVIGQYSDIGLEIPKIRLIMLALNALAAVCFIISVFRTKTSPILYVVTCVGAMLWLMLMLVDLYFDMYVQINSPNKTVIAFALVSAILFLSGEIRLPLNFKKHSIRLFSAAMAVIFLAVSSVPTLIAHFSGAFGKSYEATIVDVICLALLLPVCARFIKLCFNKTEEPEIQTESDHE